MSFKLNFIKSNDDIEELIINKFYFFYMLDRTQIILL